MAESKKPTSPKTINDVTHADKTSPSDTSRPVIIKNRPILKDPMMSEKPAADVMSPELSTESGTTKVKSAGMTGEKIVEAVGAEHKAVAVVPKAPEPDKTASAAEKSLVTPPPDVSRGELATDPVASEDIEASQQAEHEAAVQKLIDSKHYYLPIETLEHRRSKRFVALGIVLSLVLTVAWVDIALDANLIRIAGVKPLTHFFSN